MNAGTGSAQTDRPSRVRLAMNARWRTGETPSSIVPSPAVHRNNRFPGEPSSARGIIGPGRGRVRHVPAPIRHGPFRDGHAGSASPSSPAVGVPLCVTGGAGGLRVRPPRFSARAPAHRGNRPPPKSPTVAAQGARHPPALETICTLTAEKPDEAAAPEFGRAALGWPGPARPPFGPSGGRPEAWVPRPYRCRPGMDGDPVSSVTLNPKRRPARAH